MTENWLRIGNHGATSPTPPAQIRNKVEEINAGNTFARTLQKTQQQNAKATVGQSITLSAHASERLRSRGIVVTEQTMRDLSHAADTLAQKNAKESLVVVGTVGFVLSVPNRTVVTAMRLDTAEPSVITNIDSAIVMAKS